MSMQLGRFAADLNQKITEGRIRFHDWLGKSWGVLFSHPKDFTPVWTTELAGAGRLNVEWDRRDVRVIGPSIDPVEAHRIWEADVKSTQGQQVNFPMLADNNPTVSQLCANEVVEEAWRNDQDLTLHGLIYGIGDGLLQSVCDPISQIAVGGAPACDHEDEDEANIL